MNTVEVHIKEIDKGDKKLTLQNLREEIVGFLYRDTVARSTRADMQFYILLFFASIPAHNKTSLEAILDEGIPKFDKLNEAFQKRRGYLRANEYHEMVDEHGLRSLFYKDLFFVLTSSVLNLDAIRVKFADIIDADKALSDLLTRLETDYKPRLETSFEQFKASKIEDDRIDENGNYHDLSKSVYRTVLMRSSRNLELNMQKYTAVKKIESNSPIDLTFLQYIDPNTVIELWDKYHVAQYMTNIVQTAWKVTDHGFVSGGLLLVVERYLAHRRTDGNEDRKKKRNEKLALEVAVNQNEYLKNLNAKLVESVLQANTRLEADIKELKEERLAEARKSKQHRDEETLKNLTERIKRLENVQVETKAQKKKSDTDNQTKIV